MKYMGKILERDIQREICEWLKKEGYFFWRSNNVPVFARSNDGKMRYRAMPKFSMKGIPDIIVLFRGTFIGLEVKRPEQKPTEEQMGFATRCFLNGGYWYCVDSLAAVKAIQALQSEYAEKTLDGVPL